MASKYQFITELYHHTLLRVTSNHERWTGFLRAACYNYKCSFDEQILIYAQRPTPPQFWNWKTGTGALAVGLTAVPPELPYLMMPRVKGDSNTISM